MPIIGTGHSNRVNVEAPYFQSLQDLDKWAARPQTLLQGIIPYKTRPQAIDPSVERHGKLLVSPD
jgi:mannosyl-glycoprotein endo-beta-N-acetylglucosaminidase